MVVDVHIVAITRLATGVEQEAAELARELGGVAYDHRMKLTAGMPAIVLTSADEARARALAARLRAREHGVVCCAASEVVARSEMIAVRRFALEPDALVSSRAARLAWSDIEMLVRATLREVEEAQTTVTKSKLNLGRAVMTGGLMTTKKVKQEVTARRASMQGALYIFQRSSGVPWLVLEQDAEFEPLGSAMTTSSTRNFALLVDRLRELAPAAAYDDRLVTRKVAASELDMYAHLIALTSR